MSEIELVAQSAWKGTVMLGAAFGAAWLLRNASAAVRHFVWTAALAGLLLLPVAMGLAPHWQVAPAVAVVPAAAPLTGSQTVLVVVSGASALPLWLALWAVGCMLVALRWLAGALRTAWIAGRAAPADYAQPRLERAAQALGIGRRVRVLESADVPVPLAWGTLRPTVLLPEDARQWSGERLERVLLHELTHVARFDLLAQAVAQGACCLYWFHPLAWMAARQLRKERERACDDAVLLRGVAPGQYADDLMHIARALVAWRGVPSDAPAMAAASELEVRVRALFERGRNRHPLRLPAACAIAVAVAALLLPIAAVTVHAQASRGALAGVVEDASGGRIPGCRVNARNQDGSNLETTRCDMAGEYRFASIPPGRYTLEVLASGFARFSTQTVVTAGAAGQVDARLEVGALSEKVVVAGGKTAASASPAVTPHRIRVGGNVQAAKLVRRTNPEYPAELKQQGIQGAVMIRAVISTTGAVLSPVVVNTVDARLAKAALDAVSQWQYEPVLLNGQPVEATTTVTVEFTLD